MKMKKKPLSRKCSKSQCQISIGNPALSIALHTRAYTTGWCRKHVHQGNTESGVAKWNMTIEQHLQSRERINFLNITNDQKSTRYTTVKNIKIDSSSACRPRSVINNRFTIEPATSSTLPPPYLNNPDDEHELRGGGGLEHDPQGQKDAVPWKAHAHAHAHADTRGVPYN